MTEKNLQKENIDSRAPETSIYYAFSGIVLNSNALKYHDSIPEKDL